tara:strand:+ start:1322 stop:1555 length:234 start_codon:yes stop_codon:yes gene_type:complete
MSKENNNKSETLKTTNAQNNEKLRIKLTFVLLVNERTKTPNRGKSIRKDSIKKFEMRFKGLEPLIYDLEIHGFVRLS